MEQVIKITERPDKWVRAFCISIAAFVVVMAAAFAISGEYPGGLALLLFVVPLEAILLLSYLFKRCRAELTDEKIEFYRGRKLLVSFRWDEVAEIGRCYESCGRGEYIEKLYVSEEKLPMAETDKKGRFLLISTVTSYLKPAVREYRDIIKCKIGTLIWSEKLLEEVKKFYNGEIRFYYPESVAGNAAQDTIEKTYNNDSTADITE